MTAPTPPPSLDQPLALREERAFLLTSIRDLEVERSVGDIDQVDYDRLLDDYTRRAAEVVRALESDTAAPQPASPRAWRQAVVWLVGLALLGGMSGVLVARSSGTRSNADTFTGGVRESQVARLNRAQGLLSDQSQWDAAIDIFGDVLDDDPSNTEALTYRAWLQYRQGADPDTVLVDLTEATRLDPLYADPLVFAAIVYADTSRYTEAADVLDQIDLDTAPGPIAEIVTARGLTGEVYGEAVYQQLLAEQNPSLQTLGLTIATALAAADYLLTAESEQSVVAALKLYSAIEDIDPDNPEALSRRARVLAATGDPALLERARSMIDRAVTANPNRPEPLVSRAIILLMTNDTRQACRDLSALLDIDNLPPQLEADSRSLIEQSCQ